MLLVVILIGSSLSFILLKDSAEYFSNHKEQQRMRDEKSIAEARQSLINYMLLRFQYPFDIASHGSPIHPRLLMLPCPDNVGSGGGDKNLDGSQDPTCAAKPPSSGNIVNYILGSGSRFGRLPWKLGVPTPSVISTKNKINDGLGKDFRDSHGNRLWYALSKNLAPQSTHTEPLNLHRLATLDEHWLSVVDIPDGGIASNTFKPSVVLTLSERVAAVVLAPGKHKSGRLAEALIPNKEFSSAADIDPEAYFEGITVEQSGTIKEYANHNKDGVFINLRDIKRGDFDDSLAYITVDELLHPHGYFLSAYQKLVGGNSVHNQPHPNSPLASTAAWLNAYYDFFEFYPTPAAQSLTANITTTSRHCAAYHSGDIMLSAVVNRGAVFLLPNTVVATPSSIIVPLTIAAHTTTLSTTLTVLATAPLSTTLTITAHTTTLSTTLTATTTPTPASATFTVAITAPLSTTLTITAHTTTLSAILTAPAHTATISTTLTITANTTTLSAILTATATTATLSTTLTANTATLSAPLTISANTTTLSITFTVTVTTATLSATFTISANTTTLSALINLEAGSELLAAHRLTLSLITPSSNIITWNDRSTDAQNMVTVSRYARLRLADSALFDEHATPIAGALISLAAAATVVLPAATPLSPTSPNGHLSGWLPEHYKTTMTAGNKNSKFIIQAAVKAGFLSPTILSATSNTITLFSKDHVYLAANSTIKLAQDFSELLSISGAVHFSSGELTTLTEFKPLENSFEQRQHVIFLLADAIKGSKTITAPAVLYPWREETSSRDLITRDNLHPYPPCSDTRNFFDSPFRTFIEDQPTHYIVAGECHYGGEWAECGKSGGLTVSLSVGVTVALPTPLTLTQTYIATVHNGNEKHTLTINDGIMNGDDITLIQPYWFPIINNGTTVDARVSMALGSTLTNGETIIFAAQTPLIAENPIHFQQVRALLIYSPAPLPRTPCTKDMNTLMTTTVPSNITVASQHGGGDSINNLSALCRRMDNEENADGDGKYLIPSPPADKRISPSNDYFILFGGQAVWE